MGAGRQLDAQRLGSVIRAVRLTPAPVQQTLWKSVSVNDQLFLAEKLERAVPFHVDRVAKIAVGGWKHRDDNARLMVVGCFVDLVANCKLRHRKLLYGIVAASIPPKWLTLLKHMPPDQPYHVVGSGRLWGAEGPGGSGSPRGTGGE